MDIEPFRKAHKKAILEHFEKDGIDCLSLYSATSFCPIWAVYMFVLEEFPDNEEIKKRIDSCSRFYGFSS